MKPYKSKSGNGGVNGYEIVANGLALRFQDGSTYLYTYKKPGKAHVEEMKRLAAAGRGLTTYVNQRVRENYEKKL